MSPEKQRIKIAEACGWNAFCCYPAGAMYPPKEDGSVDRDPSGRPEYPPDYLNDLNAMHEAEKTLSPNLRNEFIAHLWKVTGNEPSVNFWTEYNFRGLYACIHATAAQRAEAFLRTLNLWEESA